MILGICTHRDGQAKHISGRLDRLALTVQYLLEALWEINLLRKGTSLQLAFSNVDVEFLFRNASFQVQLGLRLQ